MAMAEQDKAERLAKILQVWRADGVKPCCPACAATGLEIKDLSARPHTEWYRFTCAACGLNETLALAQAASAQNGMT